MSYTQREDARSHDSITTFDSPTLSAGAYTASATLGCASELVAILSAIKGAGAFVQGATSASASGGSLTASQAFSGDNTAGNCIIVDASMSSLFIAGGTFATCSDTQGNTYTLIGRNAVAGGNLIGVEFIAFGVNPGPNTVTITFAPGFGDPPGPVTIAVHEYTGGSSIDTSTGASGSGSSVYPMSLTTTSPGELLHLAVFIAPTCAGSPFAVTGGLPQAWLIVDEPSLGLTDRTSFLMDAEGGHSFKLELRQRGKASFRLVSDPNNSASAPTSYQPTVGEPIYLFDQNASGYTLVFAGFIQDFTEVLVGNQGLRYIDCTAASLESIFDTVYAQPMQFVNQTCGAILTALFNAFESGSPVSLGTIQPGATIPLFNAKLGDKLSDLYDQLATTSQFIWGVDPSTQLLFFKTPTTTPAPFTITSATVLWDSISRKYDAADYRNRQGVKLSFDAFPHSEEHFAGSGQTVFTLMRPVEQIVGAYVTTATPNAATAAFSGQPSPGDTITIGPAQGPWQSAHIYGLNGVIVIGGIVFQVTTAGTSGSVQPPGFLTQTVVGDTVNDNTVIWTCRGPSGSGTFFNTWTFFTSLDNTQFGQILIGATLAATVQNTVDALNAAAPYNGTPAANGKGLTFSLPTWENSQVNAVSVTGTGFTVTQKIPGSGWIAGLTSTGTAFAWSAAVTTGGTSPQTSVGPNEPAWLSIAAYVVGTANTAPGLSYTPGSASVNLATPLNVGTNLVIEYTRTDGDTIEVERTDLVTALAVLTHGTGKIQQFTDQSSTGLVSTSAAAGLQLAQEILAAYDVVPQELSIEFYRPGIVPGQIVTLAMSSPIDFVNGSYLVNDLSAEFVIVPKGASDNGYLDSPAALHAGHYRYTATLINITQIGTSLDVWKLFAGGGGSGSGGGGAGGGSLVATTGSTGQTAGNSAIIGGVKTLTTSYSAVAGDNNLLLSFNSSSPITLTLPAAPPFAQWAIFFENIGTGALTVSPNGLTIDGSASSLTVGTNQGGYLSTDGSNYQTSRGMGLVNPMTTKGDVIVGAASGVPARLAVGANGKVLTANSSATNGLDYEAPIALTTTGTSGAASLTPGNPYVLNVPQYSGGGGGGGLTLIASSVLSGGAANVTFSSIPGTFNNLQLVIMARSNAAVVQDFLTIQFNGDTAAHYTQQNVRAQGTSIAGQQQTAQTSISPASFTGNSATAGLVGICVIDIPAYALTTFFKYTNSRATAGFSGSPAGIEVESIAGGWLSAAAINAILIAPAIGTQFLAGSAFYLYGY